MYIYIYRYIHTYVILYMLWLLIAFLFPPSMCNTRTHGNLNSNTERREWNVLTS